MYVFTNKQTNKRSHLQYKLFPFPEAVVTKYEIMAVGISLINYLSSFSYSLKIKTMLESFQVIPIWEKKERKKRKNNASSCSSEITVVIVIPICFEIFLALTWSQDVIFLMKQFIWAISFPLSILPSSWASDV